MITAIFVAFGLILVGVCLVAYQLIKQQGRLDSVEQGMGTTPKRQMFARRGWIAVGTSVDSFRLRGLASQRTALKELRGARPRRPNRFCIVGGAVAVGVLVGMFVLPVNNTVSAAPLPPSCDAIVTPGPPVHLEMTCTAPAGSSLTTVAIRKATNLTNLCISPALPFPRDTTVFVLCADKLVASEPAIIDIFWCWEISGNGLCRDADPVLTTLGGRGTSATQTFIDVPAAEHRLEVINGSPGFRFILVKVNRKYFVMNDLKPGERRVLDLSSAMAGNHNSITLMGHGKPTATAEIVLGDSP